MTEVLSPTIHQQAPSAPRQMPERSKHRLPAGSVIIPPATSIRSGHLNLDVFSPVNQNGSFEFDRVLKSGEVLKRTRKTKQWKKFYLVLRPNLLSIYKSVSEERLHKQISLSDLSAIAFLNDPKGRRPHVFGLFSPSRDYLLQARDEKDARDWVELIRKEARIDEEEEEMTLGSPLAPKDAYRNLAQAMRSSNDQDVWDQDRLGSSSPEPTDTIAASATANGIRIPMVQKSAVHDLEYSGNDHGSYSEVSDTAPPKDDSQRSSSSSNPKIRQFQNSNTLALSTNSPLSKRPQVGQDSSQISNSHVDQDNERVVWHGYLLCLKSKGGVRQWKKLWVVLRPKNLAFYKNEEEYSAHLIIPLSNIISAVEIDPVSRSKSHCMQIIAEDNSYRFCAASEEALARCLGALKSQLARKKEKDNSSRKAVIT